MRMVAPRTGAPEITIAEDQHEYMPLTVAQYRFSDGSIGVLSRWRLNEYERAAIANGEDLYICMLTGGGPMQPIAPQVGPQGYVE